MAGGSAHLARRPPLRRALRCHVPCHRQHHGVDTRVRRPHAVARLRLRLLCATAEVVLVRPQPAAHRASRGVLRTARRATRAPAAAGTDRSRTLCVVDDGKRRLRRDGIELKALSVACARARAHPSQQQGQLADIVLRQVRGRAAARPRGARQLSRRGRGSAGARCLLQSLHVAMTRETKNFGWRVRKKK